jgi:VanZ family protein
MPWLRYWGPAFAWATLTWILSTAAFSASSTSRFIIPVLHWLLPQASPETLGLLHGVIRKSAHFAEYFIFSLLVLRGVRGGRAGWKLSWALAAVAIAAGYAALDELHQTFVPERTGSALDSLLDTCGAAAAQLVAWAFALWRSRRASTPA